MNFERARLLADILKAVSHPVRLIILDALQEKELTVSELNRLVDIDQSTLSRHLAQLKRAGLVGERRDGVRVYHHLTNPCVNRLRKTAGEVLACRLKREQEAAGLHG